MSVNIKVTGGLNIEWDQIDPKVTGGLRRASMCGLLFINIKYSCFWHSVRNRQHAKAFHLYLERELKFLQALTCSKCEVLYYLLLLRTIHIYSILNNAKCWFSLQLQILIMLWLFVSPIKCWRKRKTDNHHNFTASTNVFLCDSNVPKPENIRLSFIED